jgi:hypothetical protein
MFPTEAFKLVSAVIVAFAIAAPQAKKADCAATAVREQMIAAADEAAHSTHDNAEGGARNDAQDRQAYLQNIQSKARVNEKKALENVST